MVSIILINGYLRQKCISKHNYTYKYLMKIIYSYYSILSFSLEKIILEPIPGFRENQVFWDRLLFFFGKHKGIKKITFKLNPIAEYDRPLELDISLSVSNSSVYHVNPYKNHLVVNNWIGWNLWSNNKNKNIKLIKNSNIHLYIDFMKKKCSLYNFIPSTPGYKLQLIYSQEFCFSGCCKKCEIDDRHEHPLRIDKGDNMYIIFKTANEQNKSLSFWDLFEIKAIEIE